MKIKFEDKSLYEILGIDRNAPSGAIHEMYFKLIKGINPQKDIYGFRAVHRAYTTLMDPESRRRYDSLMTCGDEIANLMNQVYSAMINGHYKGAEACLQRVVSQTNSTPEALLLLAELQFEQRKFKTSIATLENLINLYPHKILYRNHLANTNLIYYKETDDPDEKKECLEKARDAIRSAVELDEADTWSYNLMGQSYLEEQNYDEAFEWVEKGVKAVKLDEFSNLPLLLFGCVILGCAGDDDRFMLQIQRIEEIIPENMEARQYASGMVIDACFDLIRKEKYENVRLLSLMAMRIAPERKELNRLVENSDLLVVVHKSLQDLERDPDILPPIKKLANESFKFFVHAISPDQLSNAMNDFIADMEKWSEHDIRKSLQILRKEYPAILDMNKKFWNSIVAFGPGLSTEVKKPAPIIIIILIIWCISILVRIASCLAKSNN